ncbi:ranBP2-like and GRIP domain-containing protein 4 [Pelobates fuscus]|uniref:ranBP2-like and GRIP domain-containing protein 4 n=1 Tax=Pelobates fuscus TaxID=191477 RepID=UPI002FE49B94
MRRTKAEIHKYIEAAQSSTASPKEKSLKGFLFAKLYYEAKEYDQAKRCVSSYINVQERDPKAHRFLGHLFEIDGEIEKAIGCYKRSVELNPTQKDLVLKIAEMMCSISLTNGRAEYWVERASKLFPGSPDIFRLKEQLLNSQGEVGWNQLFDLIQSELYTRPDDVYVNIRLVELFTSNNRFEEAVSHCLKPERRMLRTNLEWCSCVLTLLKEYLASRQESDKSRTRTINKELLLVHADIVVLTLSTKDVQESKAALESFDQALLAVKPTVNGTDDLSFTFNEMRGHYYMYAGTQLLKMAQHGEIHWKALLEPAIFCYLMAFQVPRPKIKPIKGEENAQSILEGLACDRLSQSGHLLLSLCSGKEEFMKDVIETFANRSGQSILLKFLYGENLTMENSFMGTDEISSICNQPPDVNDLSRYDQGAVRMHGGSLQHLAWLGLQCHYMSSLPTFRKWLKHLFPRLPQESSRIDSNNPESICILDLEVFLLGVVYTSHLQLQDNFNTSNDQHQPRCLPLPICKQLFSDRQRLWWDAVYSLIHKKALPGTSAKHRLVIQQDLITLRAIEKHGLQPATIVHWARSLLTTGNGLNSFYDQREYMGRSVHYWKKVLPLLNLVKQKKGIPEPVDPLFKHFHRRDIKISEVADLENEANIAFAKLDYVNGKTDDAILAFEAIKSVASYWNLALVYQRKAEELEDDALSSEDQEEYQNCMKKCKFYLIKIIDECSAEPSVEEKLPEPLEAVNKMLESVMQSLREENEEHSPGYKHDSFITASAIKHSTPSPSKFSTSPMKTFSSKTPPRWAEDQKSLLEDLCHQVEALKKEVQELRINSSTINATHRWPADGFNSETVPDGYAGPQSFYTVPLTVSTTGPTAYYGQSPAYNSQQHLLRPASSVTPTKAPVYAMNRLTPQQHMYAYPQQMHTPPTQNSAPCVFPQEMYGPPLRFEPTATGILSPHSEEYYNYPIPQTNTNPPLPEPGYFTKPSVGPQPSKSEGPKVVEFGKTCYGPVPNEGPKPPNFSGPLQSTPASSTFKFNSNFKSNDGDFTFSSSDNACLIKLLTSDKPMQDQGKKSSSFENTSDVKNLFQFYDKGFSSNTAQISNQDKSSATLGQGDNPFSFQTSGKSTFVPPTFGTQSKDAHNQSVESDAGSELVPEDDGPHFEPVVPLPEKIEVKTGEEDEEEMFCNRAKLFRFDADTKEWKERGVGNVKILRHRVSGKIRLLMRREQVLKICANHYINADMKLKPNATSDKSYVWHAYDYADEMPKSEQLAIRFKTVDEAAHFKNKFEEAQKRLAEAEASSPPKMAPSDASKPTAAIPFGSQFIIKEGEWQCNVCLAKNTKITAACVCCQTPNSSGKPISAQDTKSKPVKNQSSIPTLAFTFSKDTVTNKISFGDPPKDKEHWQCSLCSKKYDASTKQCTVCQNPGQSSSKKMDGFGSAFAKKTGQWDCSVCLVRNEPTANNCVSCMNPNQASNAQSTIPSPATFKFALSENNQQKEFGIILGKKEDNSECKDIATKMQFGEPFIKKNEPWQCTSCSQKNDSTAKQCSFCQNLDQCSSKKADGFGAAFIKKEGQWDCSVCLVRNEPSDANCVSCQNPNQASNVQPTVPSAPFKINASQKDLGTLFAKKEGQWDCNTCSVRNEATAFKCVSCSSPKTAPINVTVPSVIASSGFKFGTTAVVSKPPSSNTLEAMFARKNDQWDCNICLVRNEDSAATCVACQSPNPNVKTGTTSSSTKTDFTFGITNNMSEPSGQTAADFKCNFAGKDFKFGITETKASSFSFKAPVEETKPAKGFSFVMPANSASFKFGITEPNKSDQKAKETSNGLTSTVIGEVKLSVAPAESGTKCEESKQEQTDVIIGQSVVSSTFSDLAQVSTAEGFAFNTDPRFKGFSRAGEKLFVTNDKSDQGNTSVEQETPEELYKTDDRDDIHFEPIVQLPDKVDLVTGEEDEKVLYSQRVKLFRFDAEISQWKERGVGLLKILKNEVNGKLRMLMRREQVLKVCANHWITTTMNLKPLSGSDRAWMWMASDFSDGDARLEQLAVKFKNPEQAEEFKNKFEECQRLLLDIPLQTPHKLVDTGRTAHLIQKAEEMKSGLKDLKTFLTDKVKPQDEGDACVSSSTGLLKNKPVEGSEATYEWDTYDMRGHSLEGNLDDSVYASPLAESPEKENLFRFGESTAGFSFSFQPSPSPSKSPTKLNHSRVSVGTDEESDVTQEEERDGQYFEPVVPLPDLIEVTSGEENEQTLFCNRAKLYRFEKDANQWKERGIGDLKILQNFENKAVRVVMRRDQVLKLCANHRITPEISLQPMKGAERAWVWTAFDFTEGEGRMELFAVRFKLQDVADLFKEVFEEAKGAQANDSLLIPSSSRVTTPKALPCGKAAVAILEETTRERTDQQKTESDQNSETEPEPVLSPSEKSSKAVVSPPKFVFGSDVVKNIFGTEKPKHFTFGNTATAGTLFGFSFNASKTETSEEQEQDAEPAPSNLELTPTVASQKTQIGARTPSQSNVQNSTVSSSGSSALKQPMPARDKNDSTSTAESTSDVEIVYELTPTPEQRELAEKLQLPPTFFCYKNKPGYSSDESEVDDEDFDTAVKKLNGQLYPKSLKEKASPISGSCQTSSTESWKDDAKIGKSEADNRIPPSALFSDMSSITDKKKEHSEDIQSAVRKVEEAEKPKEDEVSSTSDVIDAPEVATLHQLKQEVDSTTEPVDLSSKYENEKTESSSKGVSNISFSFGLNSGPGLSFAELASNNSEEFAFGSKDTGFQWANTGAAVFSSSAVTRTAEDGEDCNEEVVHSDDVYFEPIVSLPEVEVKSGEEDEEILFKERAKLYRWDRDINQWKERGVGEIKILFHHEKKYYRVLMRREQVLKVCANHVISKAIKLSPLNTSNNALVWTATDYSDGEGRIEQFAARFKNQELADSFQRKFEECQQILPDQPDDSS